MKNKKYTRRPVVTKTKSRKYLWLGLILLVLLAGITIYLVHRHDEKKPVTVQHLSSAGQATKGQPTGNNGGQSGTTAQGTPSTSGGSSKTSGSTTSTTLQVPTGNFVSNHHASLSNSTTDNITSVCTTTPGASCKITFTDGSTIKSLPTEVTNSNGSAFWTNWKLQQVGLTVGSWKVTAVATLGTQTQSTTDALTLDVSQ